MMKIPKLKIGNSWIKTSVFLLILAFYGSLLIHKISLPAYDDLPRQIRIGEDIVHGNFDVFYRNVYSYSEPEHIFYNHHWLSAVVFYLISIAAGWKGLVVFKTLVLLSAFSLLFFTALRKASFWLVSAASVPAILILAERTSLRPEIFSYLFIAIFLSLLFYSEDHPSSRKIFWLIPLQLLWVNMHVFFSIGIMLAAGFLFEKIVWNYRSLAGNFRQTMRDNLLIRNLSILLIGLVLVSLINPRGIAGVLYHYPSNFPMTIIENQTLADFQKGGIEWGNVSIATFEFSVILLASVFILLFLKKRKNIDFPEDIPVFYLLACASTAILSFAILRALALFAIIFLIAAPPLLDKIFRPYAGRFASRYPKLKLFLIALLFLVLIILLLPQSRKRISPYSQFGLGITAWSESSADFFRNNNLEGPIFNDADIGSYLIYYLYPQEKVFLDNRFGDAYSASIFSDINEKMLSNEQAWRDMSERYGFNTIFFYQYDEGPYVRDFLWRRARDPAWSLVYLDMYAVIFVRNIPENKDVIDKFAITRENIQDRLGYLAASDEYDDLVTYADACNLIGRKDLASEAFLRIVYQWPEKGNIWMIMGEWELSNDQQTSHVLAMMYLERAISAGQRTAEAYSFLGMAYEKLGQHEKSAEALRQALKINPDRRDANDLLFQIEGHAR